ncbi:MAG: hypothetical protein ABIQ32_11355 [Sphingomicrobium sp.]
MTMNSIRAHSATLIALAIVGASVLVGCQAWGDAPAATGTKAAPPTAKIETMTPIRFFGDDFPEAYAALASQPVEAAPTTF